MYYTSQPGTVAVDEADRKSLAGITAEQVSLQDHDFAAGVARLRSPIFVLFAVIARSASLAA